MCTHAMAVLVTGFVLAAAGIFAGPAHAQRDIAKPAVQDLASKPIGKVVVATGSVTLERASAVVVQAGTAGQAGQAKVGDRVTIIETRPISIRKHFRLDRIIEKPALREADREILQ